MNWFKKQMAKNYVKQRKMYFIAFGIALISVVLMVVAFILDELSGLTDIAYCGFLQVAGAKYADCVDFEPCAQAQMSGIFWIVFGLLGIVMCFAAPALLGVKKSLSFIPYIFSVLFYVLSIVLWLSDNPMCWTEDGSIGTSLILAMVAAGFALIAFIVAAIPKFKK